MRRLDVRCDTGDRQSEHKGDDEGHDRIDRVPKGIRGGGYEARELRSQCRLVRSPTSQESLAMNDITTEQAAAIVEAARAKAETMDIKQNIAVVDAGANLKAFLRMDGAWLGSIDVAIRKARTARYFDMPTGDLGEMSQPGESLFAIEHSNGGLITFPGGLPLKNGAGDVVGAIGISGSTVDDDLKVAKAGVAALT